MAPDDKPIDDIMPGKDLGVKVITIDETWLRRYVDGIEESNPWYTEDSPFGGPVSPAAILHYEPWRFPGWRPPAWGGVLNSTAEWEFFKAIRPGDRLSMRGSITDRYIRRNREFVTIEILVTNEAGEAVCRGASTGTWTVDLEKARPDVPRRD